MVRSASCTAGSRTARDSSSCRSPPAACEQGAERMRDTITGYITRCELRHRKAGECETTGLPEFRQILKSFPFRRVGHAADTVPTRFVGLLRALAKVPGG